jgi:hypothetical protein
MVRADDCRGILGMTQHSDLLEEDAVAAAETRRSEPATEVVGAAASSREDELELGLRSIAVGLIAFVCALLLAEVLRTIARHTGERFARRHPILAELEWEARHHHRH